MLALVIAAKPVYLPLAGLVLLVPARWRIRLGAAGLAGLPGIGWFLLARRVAAVPFPVPTPYASGPLWPGPAASFVVTDPAMQAQVLLHQPSLLLSLPTEAILFHGAGRIREMIGILGKLDLLLPTPLYAVWMLAVVAAILAAAAGGPAMAAAMPRWGRPWAGVCLLASVFAVYLSQYLAWTQVGADEIAGVQGRYFVPLLPFLALALPCTNVGRGGALEQWAIGTVLAAAAMAAIVVPVLTAMTYWLR